MEKFAIDLDRVLDEFELNEDRASELGVQKTVSMFEPGRILLLNSSHSDAPNSGCSSSGGGCGAAVIEPVFPTIGEDSCDAPNLIDSAVADFLVGFDWTTVRPKGDAAASPTADRICAGIICDSMNSVSASVEPVFVVPSNSCSRPVNSLVSTARGRTENGIKVLHGEEVVNKDYVVNFGRKANAMARNTEQKSIDEDDVTFTAADGTVQEDRGKVDMALLLPPWCGDVAAAEAVDIAEGGGAVAASTCELKLVGGTPTEEVFATPDDDDSSDSAVDMAPTGFSNDVSVTDDEMERYLQEDEVVAVDNTEIAADKPSYQVDTLEEPFCTVDASALEATGRQMKELPNLVGQSSANMLVAEYCVSRVSSTLGQQDTVMVTENDSVEIAVVESGKGESQNGAILASFDESAPIVEDRLSCLEDAEADEGYEPGEPSPSDVPLSNDLFQDGHIPGAQFGAQRPTSLCLPDKIEYQSPSSLDASSGDERPFSALVATAGSPDVTCLDCQPNREDQETAVAVPLQITEDDCRLGKVPPVWVPDAEASNCMQCDVKFTVLKRRHHCRACGKVLCAQCCGTKARLQYMDNREARVCLSCVEVMKRVEVLESEDVAVDGGLNTSLSLPIRTPNPNNPSEYCSVIPPLQQVLPNAPPPTVMVPVGVLKRGGGRVKGEPKQVMFSDGIRPGGDLSEMDVPDMPPPNRRQGRLLKKVEPKCADSPNTSSLTAAVNSFCSNAQQECFLNEALDMEMMLSKLRDESAEPMTFCVSKNLKILVKIVNLDCCIHRTCWTFTTKGMAAVGQDEIIVLLEILSDEKVIPFDVIHHLESVYDDASKGVTISGMGHSIFTQNFLGSREHGGFLYVRPTFQCLQKLFLPSAPYLFAILLQKWETPWAKIFPLRLLLRLGAEFRYYPCPLIGVRHRKPVYCEIGHTIMNLLADFRNYQYSLPSVPGLVIHIEDKQTFIRFPRNRYDEVIKALNSSIDHVLALAATFSSEADSHLVCIQGDDGNYQTQAINIKDKLRQVTGASFVVFNGALKSSSGLTAKSSIVEDGLMLQISSDSMQALRQSLRDMKDYIVQCGAIGAEQPDEVVYIRWVDDDRTVNIGVKSPIDDLSMDGISSIRIHCGTDYVGDGLVIRWTEVYLMKTDEGHRSDPVDLGDISESLARACCLALTPHLVDLFSTNLLRIGLRVKLDAENVGYEIGAGGERLPSRYMNDLDCELVPAIHSAASPSQDGAIVLELIFHILQQ